jgi:hypothetical protein
LEGTANQTTTANLQTMNNQPDPLDTPPEALRRPLHHHQQGRRKKNSSSFDLRAGKANQAR